MNTKPALAIVSGDSKSAAHYCMLFWLFMGNGACVMFVWNRPWQGVEKDLPGRFQLGLARVLSCQASGIIAEQ